MIVYGNIGSAVEAKTSKNGSAYYAFSVAENHGKDENKTTTWYKVLAFISEQDADLLGKGVFVRVEGRLSAEAFKKRDSEEYAAGLTLMAFHVEPSTFQDSLRESKRSENRPASNGSAPRQAKPQGNPPPAKNGAPAGLHDDFIDDDIPF